MAGLPRSIIKKYGVSKKAWAVFRAGRRAVSRSTPARRAVRSSPMAKRKRSFGKARRSVSRYAKSLPYQDVLFAAGYGAVRQNVVSMAMPLISKVPAGNYADNVTLGGSAFLLHGFVKNPMAKQALKTVLVSEAFLAGAKLRNGISMTADSTVANGLYI